MLVKHSITSSEREEQRRMICVFLQYDSIEETIVDADTPKDKRCNTTSTNGLERGSTIAVIDRLVTCTTFDCETMIKNGKAEFCFCTQCVPELGELLH